MQRSKHLFIEIVAELRKDPPPYPQKNKENKEKKEKMSNSR